MTPAFVVAVAAVIFWGTFAAILIRYQPPRPLWPRLLWFALSGTLWSAGELGTSFLANGAESHWAWLVVLYTGVLTCGPIWWSLCLRFAEQRGNRPRWASSTVEHAPFLVAAVCWITLITNPYHGWFIDPVWNGRNTYRFFWYVQALSSYASNVAAMAVLFWLRRATNRDAAARGGLNLLLAASIAPALFNVLYISRVWNWGVDPTMVGLAISLALVFIGVSRNRLFTISGLTLDHLIRYESDGVVIMDGAGELVNANPAASRILGVGSLAPGVDFVRLLSERFEEGAEQTLLSLVNEAIEDSAAIAPSHCFPVKEPESACRWMRVHATGIPGRWPERRGIGLRLRDETPLYEAMERAAQQAASIEAIVGSIRDGLFVVDAHGRLSYANDPFWSMWNLARRDDASVVEEELLKELASRVVERDRRRLRDAAVAWHPMAAADVELTSEEVFSLATAPLMRDGLVAGRVWTFRDVTERTRAERERRDLDQRIRESQKLESLGVLAGGIAHDFNNILVGILGNVELALLRAEPEGADARYLTRAKASADRAADLVQQLLDYAGRGPMEADVLDLSSLVRETQELVKTAVSKKADIRVEMAPDLFVSGDPVQLRQIIMNLLTNASDALSDGSGVVTIRTGARKVSEGFLADALPHRTGAVGDYAFLQISDTGCGMDEETQSRIFEPFFSTKFTGRGLGLAATLGIVRSHGGFVKVQSQPGEGTTFLLMLPLVPDRAPAEVQDVAGDALYPSSGTVLVVDDEEPVRTVAKCVLELEGFQVLIATDGRDGMRRFCSFRDEIDVVVLDMTMPLMDGAETLMAIREKSPDVPVILSSGYSEEESRQRCAGQSGVHFIHKPYTAHELVNAVRASLQRAVAVR